MNYTRPATASRRPAPRRALPYAKRRSLNAASERDGGDALLAHWTAMQQAMAATGALRS